LIADVHLQQKKRHPAEVFGNEIRLGTCSFSKSLMQWNLRISNFIRRASSFLPRLAAPVPSVSKTEQLRLKQICSRCALLAAPTCHPIALAAAEALATAEALREGGSDIS
jgi:hypothetical protein